MRSVELEMVSYRTPDIEEASRVLICTFAKFSEIAGTAAWYNYLFSLEEIIRHQKPKRYKLSAPGINVWFSGFQPPLARLEPEKLTFETTDPGFAVLFDGRAVLPRERTHIEKVTDAIAVEMREVYHMDVVRNPHILTFPKARYARAIEVVNAALVSPGNP